MPLISVVIPVYNAQATIRRCVESVLRQTFTDYEMILVDDGSTDDSPAVCDELSAAHACVRVIHQPNGGVSCARNSGMAAANGAYIFFLDGDDDLEETTLEAYVSATENGRVDAIVGGLTVVENGTVSKRDGPTEDVIFEDDLWECVAREPRMFGYAGGKMIRRSIVTSRDLRFDIRMHSQEDLHFFLSVYPCCQTVRTLPFYGYRYDYTPSKRTPMYVDFIANQLKLMAVASQKTTLSDTAVRCVADRVAGLVYSGLYDATRENRCEETATRFLALVGLTTLLEKAMTDGDKGRVVAWFLRGRVGRIRRHFRFRQCITSLLGRGHQS